VIKIVKYVLNSKKGTIVNHPEIGKIPGLVAIPISDKQAIMCKHIIGLIVFDEVKGINVDKLKKEMFGMNIKNPESVK